MMDKIYKKGDFLTSTFIYCCKIVLNNYKFQSRQEFIYLYK